MRRYDVVTLFPELVHAVAESGIPAQAKAAGLYGLQCWNPETALPHRSGAYANSDL